MSHDDVAKSTRRSCGGSFYFLEKSKSRVAKLGAVAVEVLHLLGKMACAKDEEIDEELFVEGFLVERGDCEVDQRQRCLLVRQLLTSAQKAPEHPSQDAGRVATVATRNTSR